jgi:hypothetical protein
VAAEKNAKGQWAKGNKASLRHGFYALGALPKGASHVRRLAGQFRAALTRLVRERHGGVDLVQGGLILSATRHEARAGLLQRWLRDEGDSLPLADRLGLVREIGVATDARDRAVKALGLDEAPSGLWPFGEAGGRQGNGFAFQGDDGALDALRPGGGDERPTDGRCAPATGHGDDDGGVLPMPGGQGG